jgi:hypothetical protein
VQAADDDQWAAGALETQSASVRWWRRAAGRRGGLAERVAVGALGRARLGGLERHGAQMLAVAAIVVAAR